MTVGPPLNPNLQTVRDRLGAHHSPWCQPVKLAALAPEQGVHGAPDEAHHAAGEAHHATRRSAPRHPTKHTTPPDEGHHGARRSKFRCPTPHAPRCGERQDPRAPPRQRTNKKKEGRSSVSRAHFTQTSMSPEAPTMGSGVQVYPSPARQSVDARQNCKHIGIPSTSTHVVSRSQSRSSKHPTIAQ